MGPLFTYSTQLILNSFFFTLQISPKNGNNPQKNDIKNTAFHPKKNCTQLKTIN